MLKTRALAPVGGQGPWFILSLTLKNNSGGASE
jgi:hypothetical protein